MTIRAWRIDKAKRAATAFNGEGARLNGGRWNTTGTPVVYTSDHQALAALEILVHSVPDLLLETAYCLIAATFADDLVDDIAAGDLPPDWATDPAPAATQALGVKWLSDPKSKPILRVPSAVIRTAFNYLLNPRHPRFGEIEIGQPEPFQFDPRLAKKS